MQFQTPGQYSKINLAHVERPTEQWDMRLSWLFFGLLLAGCTSLDFDGYRQTVRIKSERPGAEIWIDGEMVGTTPAIVGIKRTPRPQITLSYPGQAKKTYRLDTHYRWRDSFFSNFGILTLAPLGWLIDISTRTAWDIIEPQPFEVPGTAPPPVESRRRNLAIAPPVAPNFRSSQAAAQLLEDALRKQNQGRPWSVVNYSASMRNFDDYHYTFESRGDLDQALALGRELNASHIVDSKLIQNKNGVAIEYSQTDLMTGDKSPTQTLNFPNGEFEHARHDIPWLRSWFLDFLPNSAGIDLAGQSLSVEVQGREPLKAKVKPINEGLGTVTRFLGTIGFANLRPPKSYGKATFFFRIVPALNLAFHRYEFQTGSGFFPDTDFALSRISFGFGPSVGVSSSLGALALSLVPGYSHSWLSWSSPVDKGSLSEGALNTTVTLEFYRHLSSNVALRLFVRSVSENTLIWATALDRSQGLHIPVSAVSNEMSGLSILYYFPELRWRFLK